MDLSIYQIIQGPVLSDKSVMLNKKFNKLTFDVHPQATSAQIKEALYKIFNLKIIKINIVCRQGKIKRSRKGETFGVFRKRAIVTLAADQKNEAFSSMNLVQAVQ